jgi:transposase
MIKALKSMKAQFNIDKVVVVADTAMIDKDNRNYMVKNQMDYIIGDSIKILGKKVTSELLNKANHKSIYANDKSDEVYTYTEVMHKGRRIICTYSSKRARKAAYEREKLIEKAKIWLEEPSKYKQVKKRGAGRFIATTDEGQPIALNEAKIQEDARYDGYKALSTTTDLAVKDIIEKYSDLFEVEHTFRALKSQIEIRPMFHWTDSRIRGHIAMCFIAFTFINHLKNTTGLQYSQIVKAIDKMQLSKIQDNKMSSHFYLRSQISDNQHVIINKLGLIVPNDTTPQHAVNQYFT